jgi:hypothetical protein
VNRLDLSVRVSGFRSCFFSWPDSLASCLRNRGEENCPGQGKKCDSAFAPEAEILSGKWARISPHAHFNIFSQVEHSGPFAARTRRQSSRETEQDSRGGEQPV